MHYNEIITSMRVNNLLKGKKPSVVYVGSNAGMIYKLKGRNRFILAINNNGIHFHFLSKWSKRYMPKKDFGVMLKDIKYYTVEQMFGVIKNITIYTHDGYYLPFAYFADGSDFKQGPDNINDLLDELKQNYGVTHQTH